jgi:hypothetical protein
MLAIATGLQSSYIGISRNQCAQLSSNGTAVNSLLFFERARTINITDPTLAEDLCNGYIGTWATGIVIVLASSLAFAKCC